MVTLIIDSCCECVKTSEWTPRGGLKFKQMSGEAQKVSLYSVFGSLFYDYIQKEKSLLF